MSVEKIDFSYIRQEKKSFTTNLNTVIQNLKNPIALGLWIYLTSLPEGWVVSKEHLRKHFNIGRDRLDSVLLYLAQNMLIETGQERLADGTMGNGFIKVRCGYEFIADCNAPETTYPQKTPFTEKPLTAQPETVKPGHGKSAPIKEIKSFNKINRKQRETLPDDFEPNAEAKAIVLGKGLDLIRVISKFRAHAKSEEWKRVDWHEAFMKWAIDEKVEKSIVNAKNVRVIVSETRSTVPEFKSYPQLKPATDSVVVENMAKIKQLLQGKVINGSSGRQAQETDRR